MSDGEREATLSIAAVVVVGLLAIILVGVWAKFEPECPAGAESKWTRGGWYCVVPPLK